MWNDLNRACSRLSGKPAISITLGLEATVTAGSILIFSLLRETRRRKVFNTAALYVVGAWIVLQVTELALPALGIADYAIRFVWIAAFALFPLSLIFGWRYDITAEGVKRTLETGAEQDADPSLQPVDRVIIGSLGVIATTVIAWAVISMARGELEGPAILAENSIAVLPFKVCENHGRDRDLAGGMTIEVINQLAERGKLKVIARTSSDAWDDFDLRLSRIADSLGVQYLLTGELCREMEQLVFTGELFDRQGFILWAQRIEQGVNRWDQLTGRLATRIADSVAAELGDVAPSPAERPVDRIAHEQFLIGQEHLARGDRDAARKAFEQALARDPEYAEALFHLALLDMEDFLSAGRRESIQRNRPRIEEALELARRQLQEDQHSADHHFLLARIQRVLTTVDEELAFRWASPGSLDAAEIGAIKRQFAAGYAEAEDHFRTAIHLNPSRTEGYARLADVIERQGVERYAEALEILEAGQVRDPFNLRYNALVAKRWAGRGRYRQALELLERFKALPVTPPGAWWWQLELMSVQPRWDEKAETLVEMLLNDPGAFGDWGNRWQAWWFVSQLADLGLREEAEDWKQRLENLPMWAWARETGLRNFLVAMGGHNDAVDEEDPFSLARAGRHEEAVALLEIRRHERKLWHERETTADLALAALYLQMERQDEATRLLTAVQEQLETEFESGVRHPRTLYHLAESYAYQGRVQDALDMLQKAVDYGGMFPCSWLDGIDPSPWTELGQNPRFVRLCERGEADLQQQADRVRALLSSYDIDELLAPLVALAQEEIAE